MQHQIGVSADEFPASWGCKPGGIHSGSLDRLRTGTAPADQRCLSSRRARRRPQPPRQVVPLRRVEGRQSRPQTGNDSGVFPRAVAHMPPARRYRIVINEVLRMRHAMA